MAQLFVPQLLGNSTPALLGQTLPQLLGRIPQLLGRLGIENQEVFTPAPSRTSQTPTYQVSDIVKTADTTATTRCPACTPCEKKKTWPWLLFVGLGSAAVATGITAAAIGSRSKR